MNRVALHSDRKLALISTNNCDLLSQRSEKTKPHSDGKSLRGTILSQMVAAGLEPATSLM
jgi:hypothetical protein